jgi:hypothetical protein
VRPWLASAGAVAAGFLVTAVASTAADAVMQDAGIFPSSLRVMSIRYSPWSRPIALSSLSPAAKWRRPTASFGKFGGDLLVGNFSFVPGEADVINAFNPVTDALVGSIDVNHEAVRRQRRGRRKRFL